MSRSTEIIFIAPWHLWAQLSERQGSSLVYKTLGSNIPPANIIRVKPADKDHPEGRKGHCGRVCRQDNCHQCLYISSSSSSGRVPTGQENLPLHARLPAHKNRRGHLWKRLDSTQAHHSIWGTYAYFLYLFASPLRHSERTLSRTKLSHSLLA